MRVCIGRLLSPVIAVVCVSLASPVQAQTSVVEGRVLGQAGEPIPQAVIRVMGTERGTFTDAEGRFTLRNLAAGTWRIEARAMGFAPGIEEARVAAGGAGAIEIVLQPTPLAISGVDVTATPTGRDPMSIAQATSQLSGRELDRALGGTLGKTLESQPGMAVRYNGAAAAIPVLRGLSGDRILVLQDGRRSGDLAGSADDHSMTIDPLAARRIEVVRGPASLLYGTNALGGVINVISGDIPLEVPTRVLWSSSIQSESAFPGVTAGLRTEVPLTGGWAMTLRGGGRWAGDARIGGDPLLGNRLPNTFHRNLHGAAGMGYVGGSVSGGVVVQGYGMRHGVPLPPGEEQPVLEGRKLSASGRLDVMTGVATVPSIRLQVTGTDYSHEELEDGDVEMAFALRTLTADLVARQGRGSVLSEGAWGISAMALDYVATGEEQLTAPAGAISIGAFSYQELPLGGNGASLQMGGRLDRYAFASIDDPRFGPGSSRSFTAASGSVGISVPVAAGVSTGISAARSFRAPSVEELLSNALHIGTASFEVGDPELAAEQARGLEATLRVQRRVVAAVLSAYRNSIDDFIHLTERGDTVLNETRWPVLAYVQDPAVFRGLEGSADIALSRYLVLGLIGDVVHARLVDGTPVSFIPPARVGGSLRWEGSVLSAGGGVRHAMAQRRVGPADEISTDAYTLIDLHGGVRLIRQGQLHSIQLRVDNLTDVLYRDSASRVKSFAPNPGRNISLLYRVHF
ncbi:TonB-dependent receptor [soil metagenome]